MLLLWMSPGSTDVKVMIDFPNALSMEEKSFIEKHMFSKDGSLILRMSYDLGACICDSRRAKRSSLYWADCY